MKVTLLIRTTRSLKLTDAGKQFYLQCEKALAGIDQAIMSAVDDVEQVQGEIRINCVGGYLGEELIAQITCDFMEAGAYNNMTLTTKTADRCRICVCKSIKSNTIEIK